MKDLSERMARIETKVVTICEDVREIKGNIRELRQSVNEEMEVMSRRITLLENEMASFNIVKKVLVFISGCLVSGFIAYLFYLLRGLM
mgnify:CR=1 FL=1